MDNEEWREGGGEVGSMGNDCVHEVLTAQKEGKL